MSGPVPSFPTDYPSIVNRIHSIDPVSYSASRNFVNGTVTYLSPYISRGVISTRQVMDITRARGFSLSDTNKLLQEFAWREYFQRVWQARGDEIFEDLRSPQQDVQHHLMIESVVQAATGIEAIDNAIKDLYTTGYMHNHIRMYVASISCNIGKAHWSMPSRWMYSHLLDGDLASNTCSWQWVAGSFASKKYYCNQDNINHFTRTDQKRTFLDIEPGQLPALPLPPQLERALPWTSDTKLPGSSKPRLNVELPTLIYNSYNLDPLWRKDEQVNRVLLLEPSHFQKFPVNDKVLGFIIDLSSNIKDIQIFTGEVSDLLSLQGDENMFVSKEHPAFAYYPGVKDERDWLYPNVSGYFQSFSSFWKKCETI